MQMFEGSVGKAWLDGEITTDELDVHMGDSEYLRAIRDGLRFEASDFAPDPPQQTDNPWVLQLLEWADELAAQGDRVAERRVIQEAMKVRS